MRQSSTATKKTSSAKKSRRQPRNTVAKTVRLPRPLAQREAAEARQHRVLFGDLMMAALENYLNHTSPLIRGIDALNARMARERGYRTLEPAYDFTKDELHERDNGM